MKNEEPQPQATSGAHHQPDHAAGAGGTPPPDPSLSGFFPHFQAFFRRKWYPRLKPIEAGVWLMYLMHGKASESMEAFPSMEKIAELLDHADPTHAYKARRNLIRRGLLVHVEGDRYRPVLPAGEGTESVPNAEPVEGTKSVVRRDRTGRKSGPNRSKNANDTTIKEQTIEQPTNSTAFGGGGDSLLGEVLTTLGVRGGKRQGCLAVPGITPLAVLLEHRKIAGEADVKNPAGMLAYRLADAGWDPPKTITTEDACDLGNEGWIAALAGVQVLRGSPFGYNSDCVTFRDLDRNGRTLPARCLHPGIIEIRPAPIPADPSIPRAEMSRTVEGGLILAPAAPSRPAPSPGFIFHTDL